MRFFDKALLGILMFPFFASAQSNYKPGYVVSIKGDTVRGFIDYKGWDINPTAIRFKSSKEAKPSKFTVNDIKYFNIDNITSYRKYSGPISMDNTDPDHMIEYRDTSYKIDAVFLQELVKGKNVALYAYSDAIKSRYFIGEAPDFAPVELVYRVYYDSEHANSTTQQGRTVNENGYMKTLFMLSVKYHADSERFKNDLTENGYKSYNLVKLANEINGNINDQQSKISASTTVAPGSEGPQPPGSVFFVGAAINMNQNSPTSTSDYYGAGGRAYTSYLPAISFGLDIFANPNTQQLVFRIEASAALSQYKYSYLSKVYPYVGFKTSFNETALSISPQVILNFYNAENLKIFGGVGAVISTFSYSNASYGPQVPNPAYQGTSDNQFDFNKFDSGLLLRLGVKFGKKLAVVGTYYSNVATSQAGYFSLASSCKQIGINYFFK